MSEAQSGEEKEALAERREEVTREQVCIQNM